VSAVETAHGTHSFRIARYSLHKKASVNKCFYSAVFTVGGHDWRIRYCPDGAEPPMTMIVNSSYDSDSVFLELTAGDGGKLVEVRATYGFRMVNPVTGISYSRNDSGLQVFHSNRRSHGFTMFVRKVEQHKYLQDDCLVIECDVMVVKELQVKEATCVTSGFDIQVPPSDLSHDLRKLLESEEEADVKFKVKEEVFHAHKIVLAMRSPVFKAELYGPMRDKGMVESITIQGMDPAVFKGLLHFIYTDRFPRMDDLVEDEEQQDMVKHLLVAADRYGMERLKSMCEGILCSNLDVESVAYTMALAGQHHCSKLKSACIEFIINSNLMDVVVASQGYEHLKRACPDVAVELWENSAKSPITRSSCIGGQLMNYPILN